MNKRIISILICLLTFVAPSFASKKNNNNQTDKPKGEQRLVLWENGSTMQEKFEKQLIRTFFKTEENFKYFLFSVFATLYTFPPMFIEKFEREFIKINDTFDDEDKEEVEGENGYDYEDSEEEDDEEVVWNLTHEQDLDPNKKKGILALRNIVITTPAILPYGVIPYLDIGSCKFLGDACRTLRKIVLNALCQIYINSDEIRINEAIVEGVKYHFINLINLFVKTPEIYGKITFGFNVGLRVAIDRNDTTLIFNFFREEAIEKKITEREIKCLCSLRLSPKSQWKTIFREIFKTVNKSVLIAFATDCNFYDLILHFIEKETLTQGEATRVLDISTTMGHEKILEELLTNPKSRDLIHVIDFQAAFLNAVVNGKKSIVNIMLDNIFLAGDRALEILGEALQIAQKKEHKEIEKMLLSFTAFMIVANNEVEKITRALEKTNFF